MAWSEAVIAEIIELMRFERYRFAPARRVYIPEKNGTGQRGLRRVLERRAKESWSDRARRARRAVSPRTVWTQNLQTPLRRFLRTETGSAAVLLAATLAALAWANIDPS